jgi:hypothetical protein
MADAKSSKSGGETSQTRSMHIDNVLAGLKQEDLEKTNNDFDAPPKTTKPSILKQKEQKYQAANII